jgi:hypothetical protein
MLVQIFKKDIGLPWSGMLIAVRTRDSHWSRWLRVALSKGPNKVGVILPSPQDGNRASFRNVVFSSV